MFTGCRSNTPPLPTVDFVDLDRFMGSWFVVGYTPILVDKQAHNAVEHYYLASDGDIETTYQFRDEEFDGKLKTYTPVGFVKDTESNADWRMQFIWPFKAKYFILYISDDYQRTLIGHPNRKYGWIMQRQPTISGAEYEAMVQRLEAMGFDRSVIQRMPQDWSTDQERLQKILEFDNNRPLSEAFDD